MIITGWSAAAAEQAGILCFSLRQMCRKVWAKVEKEQIWIHYKGKGHWERTEGRGFTFLVSPPERLTAYRSRRTRPWWRRTGPKSESFIYILSTWPRTGYDRIIHGLKNCPGLFDLRRRPKNKRWVWEALCVKCIINTFELLAFYLSWEMSDPLHHVCSSQSSCLTLLIIH